MRKYLVLSMVLSLVCLLAAGDLWARGGRGGGGMRGGGWHARGRRHAAWRYGHVASPHPWAAVPP
jgi:hypothetical protein